MNELGYKLPQDMSIIGFDNLTTCAYSTPALTSYTVSKKEIRKHAVNLLLERIIIPYKSFEKIRIDSELAIRQSVNSFSTH